MNIKTILFPTDFSPYNDAALAFASTLAGETGATLHMVYVHDTRELNAAMGDASYLGASAWENELCIAHERLARMRPTVPAVAYEHHCIKGVPVAEIVALAAERKADLIVMASHGRTGLSRLLLGSVAEGVMRKAPCPVLIVKQPGSTGDGNPQPSTA